MKKFFAILLLAAMLLTLAGCGCEHEWAEASCTTPKHCTLCGEAEGEPLGHTYQDATCEDPKICARCGQTEGAPLGHDPGESVYSINLETMVESMCSTCQTCGKPVFTDARQVTELFNGALFLFTAEEFVQRLNWIYEDLESGLSAELTEDEDGTMVAPVTKGEEAIGVVYFYHPGGLMDAVDRQVRNVAQVTITFDQRRLDGDGEMWDYFETTPEQQLFYDTMLPLSMACDPMLDAEAAQIVVDDILAGLESSEAGSLRSYFYEKDGLTFFLKDSLISKVFGILPSGE